MVDLALQVKDYFRADQFRESDLKQRKYNNEVTKFELQHLLVEREREQVQLKSEQLKAIANLAAIMAGFGSTFLAQVPIPTDGSSPDIVLICFGGLAAIVIALNLVALVLCSMILVGIFNFDCVNAALHNPTNNFQHFWKLHCEADWLRAFRCFVYGIPIFLVSVAFCGWVQFRATLSAAVAVAAVCALLLLVALTHTLPRWQHVAVPVTVFAQADDISRSAFLQRLSRMNDDARMKLLFFKFT